MYYYYYSSHPLPLTEMSIFLCLHCYIVGGAMTSSERGLNVLIKRYVKKKQRQVISC